MVELRNARGEVAILEIRRTTYGADVKKKTRETILFSFRAENK